MIIVDELLRRHHAENGPIRVGLVGAGYSGKAIVHQILSAVDGLSVVAVANRTVTEAIAAYRNAGVDSVEEVHRADDLDRAIAANRYAVTDDYLVLTGSERVDIIVEATGTIEYGCAVVLSAIENGKHVVLMNVELDATVGPYLKSRADHCGVAYSNTDGDEPGVAMNMVRLVRSMGLRPVVAGNLKGLLDPYRTPETQREFAAARNQKPETMTHFADGTKLSMELNVLANATGFGVAKRGMLGPALSHVNEAASYYEGKVVGEGIVDFLCGAAPSNGAFVLGYTDDSVRMEYLQYLKMGPGPYYVFYTPFHLPHLEIPNTVARAVLLGDAAVAPQAGPVCDSVTIAKTDLRAGDRLDGMGGFKAYAMLENYSQARQEQLLPMGASEGCVLRRDLPRDAAISYSDVDLPAGRMIDELRLEQDRLFGGAPATSASAPGFRMIPDHAEVRS